MVLRFVLVLSFFLIFLPWLPLHLLHTEDIPTENIEGPHLITTYWTQSWKKKKNNGREFFQFLSDIFIDWRLTTKLSMSFLSVNACDLRPLFFMASGKKFNISFSEEFDQNFPAADLLSACGQF